MSALTYSVSFPDLAREVLPAGSTLGSHGGKKRAGYLRRNLAIHDLNQSTFRHLALKGSEIDIAKVSPKEDKGRERRTWDEYQGPSVTTSREPP